MKNNLDLNIDMSAAEAFCELKPAWSQGDQQLVDAAVLLACSQRQPTNTMLEIGTSAGEGAAALLHGSAEQGAHLHCIDFMDVVYYDRSKPVGSVIDDAFPHYLGRVTKHLKCRCDEIRKIGKKFDLVHIDGNHSHPWGVIDMLRAIPFLNSGALIVFHDANYQAAISQAAYYVARMIHGTGEIIGNHFVYRFEGASESVANSIMHIINTNWQSDIDVEVLKGLYEDLCTTFNDGDALMLCGAVMTQAAAYKKRQEHYNTINGALWRRELERRELSAKLAAAK